MISIKKISSRNKARLSAYLDRRPHRSFHKTLRRDYDRPLNLPGYWAFTKYVRKTLWASRKLFISLALVYALLIFLLVGIASQDAYSTLNETIKSTSNGVLNGSWGELGKAGLLFISAVNGSVSQTLTESQQIYATITVLMVWMTTVWLLRNILAGHKVKLRDGLYNSGAPILSTFLVFLLLIVQLLPAALALIGYSAAAATGLLNGGVEAMLFWFAAGLLVVMSLYFITSTFFALIIVTLPGMYPFKAIKAAGDIVIGRRLRILLRLLWMVLTVTVVWALIMIPVILFDLWVKGLWPVISWMPIVPIFLLVLGSITVVWVSSYIYLLYRKVVADDPTPA